MKAHPVATRQAWLDARRALLRREKELTRLRDAVSRERRALPWVRIDEAYAFEAPEGTLTLGQLFGPHEQLLVYHFMFHPDWDEGCKSCSLLADGYNLMEPHLAARDVAFVTASRAPLAKLLAYRARMGWSFRWVSSGGSRFNRDFHVSYEPEDAKDGKVTHNFREIPAGPTELPGISAFIKQDGVVYHTYSSYGRGLDRLMVNYQLLDLVARGRAEEGLGYTMSWVRRRDRYGAE